MSLGPNPDVGDRVAVRDALNELHRAELKSVPRDWRDKSRSDVTTTRGEFVKAWVSIEGRAAVPWPIDDIFTDLESAQRSVEEHKP